MSRYVKYLLQANCLKDIWYKDFILPFYITITIILMEYNITRNT